jgi:hypothetical protein
VAVGAEHRTEGLRARACRPGRWGTEAQGTHCRAGDAGQNVLLGGTRGDTSRPPTISTTLQRIAQQAIQYPALVFTTLAHLIDVELLREAYHRTRKDAAPGIDGVTAAAYAEHLEANRTDLYERLQSGRYTAPPVKRTGLDQADGSQRPIGMPTFEDKIVQRAVTMLLGAVDEQDVQDFSHGCREGHSPPQALHELREQCLGLNIGWIVDADVRGFFDRLDHGLLRDVIQNRVNDGGLLRLIGKWLHAGVLEGESVTYPEKGTPQGGVSTLPTKLQTFFFEVHITRIRIDPKHDIDLMPSSVYPLHEGTDEVPFVRPIRGLQAVVDVGRQVFQTANDQLQFCVHSRLICQLLAWLLQTGAPLAQAGQPGLKCGLVDEPLGGTVD